MEDFFWKFTYCQSERVKGCQFLKVAFPPDFYLITGRIQTIAEKFFWALKVYPGVCLNKLTDGSSYLQLNNVERSHTDISLPLLFLSFMLFYRLGKNMICFLLKRKSKMIFTNQCN